MTKTVFIKPASADVKVRDPITKLHLGASGESKPRSSYWIRRIAAGDVVEVIEQPASAKAAPKITKD
jgi:hypothetical protein